MRRNYRGQLKSLRKRLTKKQLKKRQERIEKRKNNK